MREKQSKIRGSGYFSCLYNFCFENVVHNKSRIYAESNIQMKEEKKWAPSVWATGAWQVDSGATFCSALQWQRWKAQRTNSSIPTGGQSHRWPERPDRRAFLSWAKGREWLVVLKYKESHLLPKTLCPFTVSWYIGMKAETFHFTVLSPETGAGPPWAS